MRNLLFIFLTLFLVKANGQSFETYKDSINHFSIDIPAGWKYGVNKSYPTIALIAWRTPLNSTDSVRDNFNINIIETPTKTLDKTFADLLKYLPEAQNYKLIATGDTTFNGTRFKWVIESNRNQNSDIQMHNYEFVALKNGKTYILTLITFSYYFEKVKPLFDRIASSFKL